MIQQIRPISLLRMRIKYALDFRLLDPAHTPRVGRTNWKYLLSQHGEIESQETSRQRPPSADWSALSEGDSSTATATTSNS